MSGNEHGGTLLERLERGPVVCAEGYVFELERRGYVQAGAFVPQVLVEHPNAVLELHREFLLAGSDVIQALTYYAHREKLRLVGLEDRLEEINRTALTLARRVADEGGALVAGNICNTNIYAANDTARENEVRGMFEEQVGWAVEAGVDCIVAETFSFLGEALVALDVIKKAGATSVITLAIHQHETDMRDGFSAVEACRRLRDAGADVVGLNCIRGPQTMLPLLEDIARNVSGPLAALPVAYRTTTAEPTFQSLTDPARASLPGDRSFPAALDPFTCTRYEIAAFAKAALELGFRYQGVCCGADPHHIRSMVEALGKQPPASRFSPDMSKHYALGTDARLRKDHLGYATKL
jgi:betaine-homocysteine S-methyltransferase